jgi:hypothetical protein
VVAAPRTRTKIEESNEYGVNSLDAKIYSWAVRPSYAYVWVCYCAKNSFLSKEEGTFLDKKKGTLLI